MTIVLKTLDGCSVSFDDPDPQADDKPPLTSYALPLPSGGYRWYDFTGSHRDEDERVVRCYRERASGPTAALGARVRPEGNRLVALESVAQCECCAGTGVVTVRS